MKRMLLTLAMLTLVSCNNNAVVADPSADQGASPHIGAPTAGMVPTVRMAPTARWPANGAPHAPDGFVVTRYAQGLNHPRWLYRLPNGDMLVAQAATSESKGGGAMGWVRNALMRNAGAVVDSPNTIVLLRDANGDGVVDQSFTFAQGLNQPFGMALVGDRFFVANTDAVVAFHYAPGATRVEHPERIIALPYRAADNGHWTRNLIASRDGTKLFVTVGSDSNIGDNGMDAEHDRAAVWEINLDGSGKRIFASGLRNPNGLDFEPVTGALWTTVNERDMLGDELPPDYMTSLRDGAFYGWPYSYWGDHVDVRVKPQRPDLVAHALAPDYALGAHTASLGLVFYQGALLPAHYRGGAFVGQHGSWNRSQYAGYKVVFVPFADGRPSGPIEDFLTGFINARGQAQGRPVGVAVDRTGALLVADDVGNIVWRVAPR